MTTKAVRQSAIGYRHVNLTRGLPTRPSAFERLGTLRAKTDPVLDIDRDLHETKAVIADLAEQMAQGGEVEKYARGMIRLMNIRLRDLLQLKSQWKQPIR